MKIIDKRKKIQNIIVAEQDLLTSFNQKINKLMHDMNVKDSGQLTLEQQRELKKLKEETNELNKQDNENENSQNNQNNQNNQNDQNDKNDKKKFNENMKHALELLAKIKLALSALNIIIKFFKSPKNTKALLKIDGTESNNDLVNILSDNIKWKANYDFTNVTDIYSILKFALDKKINIDNNKIDDNGDEIININNDDLFTEISDYYNKLNNKRDEFIKLKQELVESNKKFFEKYKNNILQEKWLLTLDKFDKDIQNIQTIKKSDIEKFLSISTPDYFTYVGNDNSSYGKLLGKAQLQKFIWDILSNDNNQICKKIKKIEEEIRNRSDDKIIKQLDDARNAKNEILDVLNNINIEDINSDKNRFLLQNICINDEDIIKKLVKIGYEWLDYIVAFYWNEAARQTQKTVQDCMDNNNIRAKILNVCKSELENYFKNTGLNNFVEISKFQWEDKKQLTFYYVMKTRSRSFRRGAKINIIKRRIIYNYGSLNI